DPGAPRRSGPSRGDGERRRDEASRALGLGTSDGPGRGRIQPSARPSALGYRRSARVGSRRHARRHREEAALHRWRIRSAGARALSGADVVHSIAREWVGSLERAAREAGAAFVETPLVHPGQRLSGSATADIARYRRDDAVIALTNWEKEWYEARRVRTVHVTGIGPNLRWLPEVPMDMATVLFVGRKERYKGYHALRDAARIVWRSRPEARFVAIGQDSWTARFERRWRA